MQNRTWCKSVFVRSKVKKCKFDSLFLRTLCMLATCDVRHFLLLFAITLYHHKEAVGPSPEVLESSCARDLGTDLWELRQSLHLLNFSPSKLESQSLQFTKLFNPSLGLLDGIISSRRLPRIIPFLRFFVFSSEK